MWAVRGQIKNKDVIVLPLGHFGLKSFAMMDFCVVNDDDRTTFAGFVEVKIINRAYGKITVHLFECGIGVKFILTAH